MTEDERYEIIVRDRFVCQRCGKPVGVYGQLAHRVKSGKGTLKFIENFLQQNYNKVLTKKDIKNKIIDNKKNLEDDFFYSEIAENEFNELDYKERKNNWRTYFRACQDINDKILNQTNELVKDFLKFNTGKKGNASINKKYL